MISYKSWALGGASFRSLDFSVFIILYSLVLFPIISGSLDLSRLNNFFFFNSRRLLCSSWFLLLAPWSGHFHQELCWSHHRANLVRVCGKSLQLCPTLCNPMDCSPPSSSVPGILQVKNTGMGCHALLQGIFLTQGSNPCLLCLLHR